MSGLSVTFWGKLHFFMFFMFFTEILHFSLKPMGKPEDSKTVKTSGKPVVSRKPLKIVNFTKKQQKWGFCQKLWGLGRLFRKKCQFWQVRNVSKKVVVLHKSVCWVSHCIAKKPGERSRALWDAVRHAVPCREVPLSGWCTRGSGGTGHGACPSAHPWYGSGSSSHPCFTVKMTKFLRISGKWLNSLGFQKMTKFSEIDAVRHQWGTSEVTVRSTVVSLRSQWGQQWCHSCGVSGGH